MERYVVSPVQSKCKQPEKGKKETRTEEEMLAPMEEKDVGEQEPQMEMGRRRREPVSERTGVAYGGVGSPTGNRRKKRRIA